MDIFAFETLLDEGINKEENVDKKNELSQKKELTLTNTKKKVEDLHFWSKVTIPNTSTGMPADCIYDPILDQSRKRYPWELNFEANKEAEKKYTPFPTSNKVYHFHPVAFVEQMRRMEDDPSLVWGSKVGIEFRKKVVEISKRLKCDPNHLMTCMALETGGTFDPSITNSLGYTGLIQIGTTAAKDISRRKKITITTDDLRKMTAVEQLTYVEYYLEPFSEKLTCLAAFYLAILYPADISYANEDTHVVFDKDSDSKIRKKAYSQNPLFHNEDPESGKTYVWEI